MECRDWAATVMPALKAVPMPPAPRRTLGDDVNQGTGEIDDEATIDIQLYPTITQCIHAAVNKAAMVLNIAARYVQSPGLLVVQQAVCPCAACVSACLWAIL